MAYTYLIGWSNHDKWYYGLRYAKDCDPTDLWESYFTSSKKVKMMRDIYGEPDVIEVRKVFDSVEKAMLWESNVLKRVNAPLNDRWLNECAFPIFDNRKEKNSMFGKKHSEETKLKMSEAAKNRKSKMSI